MSRLSFLILNTLSLLVAIVISGIAQTGAINGQTIGQVSNQFNTLITPPGYTFSVWSVIYLALIAHVVFQWVIYFRNKFVEVIDSLGWWFIAANISSTIWTFLWLYEQTGLSVLAMVALLWSLVQIMLRLRLETWDAPVRIIAFVWWPFAIYLGWIVVATITNVAAFLVSVGWSGEPLSSEIWTIIMLIVAAIVYLVLIFKRNLRESAIVGIWAFYGIADKNYNEYPSIAIVAGIMAVILLAISLYKGHKNRYYNPFLKLKRGEF